MQRVKIITSIYAFEFEDKLSSFVDDKDKIIHQIQYNTFVLENKIFYNALVVYTIKEEGENNEL